MSDQPRMVYREPEPRARDELERALRSSDVSAVCRAMVDAAFHEPDWRWVQGECARLATHASPHVRGLVPTCFGHLARLHGMIDREVVEPVLARLAADPKSGVAGRVDDARDDFDVFLGQR